MTQAELIYQAYPRKVGRRRALMEIQQALSRIEKGEINGIKITPEEAVNGLLKATQAYCHSPSGNRGCYTPHPSTWFHQSRYLDDPKEWTYERTEAESKDAALARHNREVLDRVREKKRAASENGDAVLEGDERGVSGIVGRTARSLLGD